MRSDIVAVAVACILARRWEGFRSRPYLCPAGVPSIGYGFTYYADGTVVTLNDPPMTRAQAQSLLEFMVRTKYMRDTIRLCPNIDSPERLGAITDFAFNAGSGSLRSSGLRKKIAGVHGYDEFTLKRIFKYLEGIAQSAPEKPPLAVQDDPQGSA